MQSHSYKDSTMAALPNLPRPHPTPPCDSPPPHPLPRRDPAKQLTILTKVVQRTRRELVTYVDELAAQVAKVGRMRSAGADAHDVSKQVEVQAECEAMVPDTRRRLGRAEEELREFVAANGEALAGREELAVAAAVLAEGEAA